MTTAQQHAFWLKFHKFQMRYELMYTSRINKALKEQVQQYIESKNLADVHTAGLYTTLLDLYKNTGSSWAYHTRSVLRDSMAGQKYGHRKFSYKGKIPDVDLELKETGQMGFSQRIVQFMQQYFGIDLLNVVETITATTKRLIGEVLAEAALQGWSFDQIVRKLEAPDFTATRARLIARTETVNAANAGSMINAKLAGARSKIWIAARDNRTREHHREVNQTIVPIEGKFTVGGYLMDHPGDKTGGAAEVCNCRCAVGFIP